jgi:hypothetical protein
MISRLIFCGKNGLDYPEEFPMGGRVLRRPKNLHRNDRDDLSVEAVFLERGH